MAKFKGRAGGLPKCILTRKNHSEKYTIYIKFKSDKTRRFYKYKFPEIFPGKVKFLC
jgi:hypothetical protein